MYCLLPNFSQNFTSPAPIFHLHYLLPFSRIPASPAPIFHSQATVCNACYLNPKFLLHLHPSFTCMPLRVLPTTDFCLEILLHLHPSFTRSPCVYYLLLIFLEFLLHLHPSFTCRPLCVLPATECFSNFYFTCTYLPLALPATFFSNSYLTCTHLSLAGPCVYCLLPNFSQTFTSPKPIVYCITCYLFPEFLLHLHPSFTRSPCVYYLLPIF